jgi:hypothetical protein
MEWQAYFSVRASQAQRGPQQPVETGEAGLAELNATFDRRGR